MPFPRFPSCSNYLASFSLGSKRQKKKKFKRLNIRRIDMFITMTHPSVYNYNMKDFCYETTEKAFFHLANDKTVFHNQHLVRSATHSWTDVNDNSCSFWSVLSVVATWPPAYDWATTATSVNLVKTSTYHLASSYTLWSPILFAMQLHSKYSYAFCCQTAEWIWYSDLIVDYEYSF